ncbi:MAG: hypothetical protein A3J38_09555 [Gammaproteobacteria bacterium RIFCSPHIGHO2_12_FULL_45_9]|nr:MAG: hypothetical protein A3J38_09555 [Gammaproteobacteria bacterium RIFCSPHIGHO2_12_FULL_45_9]
MSLYKHLIHTTIALGLVCGVSNSFAYSTKNGALYDNSGVQFNMDGVNWSGFQDSGFIDELYGSIPFYALPDGNTKIPFGTTDMLTQPQNVTGSGVEPRTGNPSVAFKTIRLPIEPGTLTKTDINTHFNASYTSKTYPSEGNGPFCATWSDNIYDTACKSGLTEVESFYKVIDEFKKNNIKILVDFHQAAQGSGARDGNVVESFLPLGDANSPANSSTYLGSVKLLAQQLKSRNLTNVIGIDVFNEPYKLNFYTTNGSQPAWIEVIAKAAQVVYENNPSLLLFAEGPASSNDPDDPTVCVAHNSVVLDPINTGSHAPYSITASDGTGTNNGCSASQDRLYVMANYGGNFKSLLNKTEAAAGNAVFDEETFRNAIIQYSNAAVADWLLGESGDAEHKGHLVFSPHAYGIRVGGWQPSTGQPSDVTFGWDFGFLAKAGYPVVLGESGYDPTFTTDSDFFENSLTPYLQQNNLAHNLFFWTFNTNSGDTGGVRVSENSVALVVQKEKDLNALYTSAPIPPTPKGVITFKLGDVESGCSTTSQQITVTGNQTSTTSAVPGSVSLPVASDPYTFSSSYYAPGAHTGDDPVLCQATFTPGDNVTISTEGQANTITVDDKKASVATQSFELVGVHSDGSAFGDDETATVTFTDSQNAVHPAYTRTAHSETYYATHAATQLPANTSYTVTSSSSSAGFAWDGQTTTYTSSSSAPLTLSYVKQVTYPVNVQVSLQTLAGLKSSNSATTIDVTFADNAGHSYKETVPFANGSTMVNLPAKGTFTVTAPGQMSDGSVNYVLQSTTPNPVVISSATTAANVALTYKESDAKGACTVTLQSSSAWGNGAGTAQTTMNVTVTNNGSTTISTPWTLVITPSATQYTSIAGTWSWAGSISSGAFSGKASESWEAIAPGASVSAGMNINSSSPVDYNDWQNTSKQLDAANAAFQATPSSVTLNGAQCAVVVK